METTLTTSPRIDFTEVGEEFIKTEADKIKIFKEAINLQWQQMAGLVLGAIPGGNIKGVIKELNIPKVNEIAVSIEGFGLSCEPSAAFSLYGIHGHYKNADVKIYVIDAGTHCVPLFMEVTEKIN